MGLLKKLKKVVKRVVKGVKKVFKKTLKFVGRAMNSKWGKALMLALTVFSAGAALGAFQGFGAMFPNATGFAAKFINGADKIIGVMSGQGAAFGGVGGANAAGAAGAAAGEVAAGAGVGAAGEAAAAGAASAGAELAAPTIAATQGAGAAAAGGAAAGGAAAGGAGVAAGEAAKKGLLARAGEYLMSPQGATLIGGALSGYGQQQAAEDEFAQRDREQDYGNRLWREDQAGISAAHRAAGTQLRAPSGFLENARRRILTSYGPSPYDYAPAMGGPVDPNTVASYARP